MEEAPRKFFRLKPGGEVRLRSAYIIRCDEVVRDGDGDGAPEVVVGALILRGLDGVPRGLGTGGLGYDPTYSNAGYHSFFANVDRVGDAEVVAGSSSRSAIAG